jgi:putative spermidine/putrescine transport system permease protein
VNGQICRRKKLTDSNYNARALASDAHRDEIRSLALCLAAFLFVGLLVLSPIAWLSWLSLLNGNGEFSFENYARIFESKSYRSTFLMTFEVSISVTVLCVILGYPLAYLFSQLPKRIAAIGMIFVILPFWTSLLVRTYAWLVMLQKNGVINSWMLNIGLIDEPIRLVNNFTGTIIGMAHSMLPFLVIPLYATMITISKDYTKAAAASGASPVQAFWQIFLPLSLPGLFSGIVFVFVLCLGFYVTPALLGGGRVQMWAMQIEKTVNNYGNWGAASALGVLLMIVTLLMLFGLKRMFGLHKNRGVGL